MIFPLCLGMFVPGSIWIQWLTYLCTADQRYATFMSRHRPTSIQCLTSSLSPLCHSTVLVTCHTTAKILSKPPSPVLWDVQLHVGASSPKTFTVLHLPYKLLHEMPSNRAPMATVKQSSPSKVPISTAGDISPTVMCQFEHTCLNYFIHKKIVADNQVPMILSRLLDHCITDWISADCDRIVALPFIAFMIEFQTNYLAEDWEEDTLC